MGVLGVMRTFRAMTAIVIYFYEQHKLSRKEKSGVILLACPSSFRWFAAWQTVHPIHLDGIGPCCPETSCTHNPFPRAIG